VPDTVGLFAALSSYNIAILYSAVLWQPVLAVDEVRVSMGTMQQIVQLYLAHLSPLFVNVEC
jgi:hypothetical protein